ncbi:hypothetical protein NHX12_007115 [Muraenolepis orangiensis]|uniref:Reverse transcriptase domain-containing protein n=1 Tax=Muraenolepis orangiensis TaxID=630683 RepID=A0A9Q0IB99_9TELE|nr:hypothetical protein NHX12_007115 [Muraenolepis orangiensis]
MIMIMINNLNHNPSSTTAKGSFHGTGISFFQFPSKSNVGHFQDGMDMPSPETKKNHWLPDNFTTVPAVALKKANVAVPQTPNQITAFEGHLSRALMTHGEDKYVVMLGGLHIEMAMWKTYGDYLEASGWTTALTKAGIASSGTVDSFLKASHLTRTRHAHQVSALALAKLQQDAFLDMVTDDEKTKEAWRQDMITKSPTFHYWECWTGNHRIEPVVDPQLPREQAGFRRGRSTVDQVTLLTQDIDDSFQAKEKVGVVLLDLTAAYDTVWHRGLHLKLLRTIPDRHMVKFIMEMLSNRSFILRTSDGQRSRLRRLRNGVPQGSVLSPLLFNIYIHDLPETTSRQYGYADDLAIMLRRTSWSAVEQGLNQDMGILAAYLRKWRLQLSTGKTVSAAYHLCNREAKRELSVSVDNKRLEHQLAPRCSTSVFGWTGHCPTNSTLRK